MTNSTKNAMNIPYMHMFNIENHLAFTYMHVKYHGLNAQCTDVYVFFCHFARNVRKEEHNLALFVE